MAFPTGNPQTSVLSIEQIGPSEARIGFPYTYDLRVTNLTNLTIGGIVVDQQLPGDFKLAASPAPSPATQKATTEPSSAADAHTRIEIGELAPRQSKTVQISGTPGHEGTFDTSLSVQYNPPALQSHVPVVAPVLRAVMKGPAQADICQDIVYQFTVANVGTGIAHDVVLQEKLPEGLLSADTQGTFSIPLGSLGPKESKDYTARLRAVRPGKYATIATAVSSDAPQTRTEQFVTSVVAPRLAIAITGPRESYFGQPLNYQIAVTNRGEAPAGRTRLRLGSTPGQIEFLSAEASDGTPLKALPGGGEQLVGTVAPGETSTVIGHFRCKQGGPVTVEATALADCSEPAAASTSTKVVTVAAVSLSVTHDPDPVAVGNNVVYHITVRNKGTAPDQNVAVGALLPNSTQLVRASGGTDAKADGQSVRFAPIDVLKPDQSVTWQVEAKAIRAEDAQFLASMTSASNPKSVVRLESTTLFGLQTGTVTGTSEVSPATTTTAPATQPSNLNK
jgi:uncharacterized repeat protein (TIGR01451 family)